MAGKLGPEQTRIVGIIAQAVAVVALLISVAGAVRTWGTSAAVAWSLAIVVCAVGSYAIFAIIRERTRNRR